MARHPTPESISMSRKEWAALDVVFGPLALRAAYLNGHEACLEWIEYRSGSIRKAQSSEDFARIFAAIGAERPYYSSIASPEADASAVAKERELAREAQRRESLGRPSLFDRRTGQWMAFDEWAPIPYVDGPEGQAFCVPSEGGRHGR